MTYFEGWYNGNHVSAEDWYEKDLVYIEVKIYTHSTRTSAPDEEKHFLLHFNDRNLIRYYDHTLAAHFASHKELRDPSGRLVPIHIELPKLDLFKKAI